MKKGVKIYGQGLEEYPKISIFLGNLLMVLWIGLGTLACWFLNPFLAYAYLISAVVVVFVVLRKLICTNCYYYGKWCHIGWGKLSALLFKKGSIEEFGTGTCIKLASITYGLLTLIPLVLIVISIIQMFTAPKLAVL